MEFRALRLTEYVTGGMKLLWRRIAMYVGATLLVALFFSVPLALVCFFFLAFTELLDVYFARRFISSNRKTEVAAAFRNIFLVTASLSAISVSGYAVAVASAQGSGEHFMPMIFLLGAALFAAMNNHQIIEILIARLTIYGFSFLYIPLSDIATTNPPMISGLWLQFISAIFILLFVVDISIIFIKLYQERLKQLSILEEENLRTKAALKAKEKLLSVVSHELKTPIAAVSGSLDILKGTAESSLPEAYTSLLTVARKNALRVSTIVSDMLDLQALESGDFALLKEPILIIELVKTVVERNNSYEKPARFRVDDRTNGVRLLVSGDRGRLDHAIDNLISNAGKFSESDQEVLIVVSEPLKNLNHISISVIDTGLGIDESKLSTIFETFGQIDSSATRQTGGLGIGLSMTKLIVELHDGSIKAKSQFGVGSTFQIDLPLESRVTERTIDQVS
jgi:signal transduction histidine kinase